MPEGLLYRGKYCGKSKLRSKIDEFGEEEQSIVSETQTLKSNRILKK